MVFATILIDSLTREQLRDELVKLSNITDRLKELAHKFDSFSKSTKNSSQI